MFVLVFFSLLALMAVTHNLHSFRVDVPLEVHDFRDEVLGRASFCWDDPYTRLHESSGMLRAKFALLQLE